jgi:exosome complex RNA-binding protein Rrp42 (RNase PH superfamily)
MNKIYFSKRQYIRLGLFVMPFSCPDLEYVRTELSPWARTNIENDTISSVQDRITLSLRKVGFEVKSINFNSMTITASAK